MTAKVYQVNRQTYFTSKTNREIPNIELRRPLTNHGNWNKTLELKTRSWYSVIYGVSMSNLGNCSKGSSNNIDAPGAADLNDDASPELTFKAVRTQIIE